MNARVLLLVLVTGLFMTAWNGDQTAMQAAYARREARQRAARIALADAVDRESTVQSPKITKLPHALTRANSQFKDAVKQPASVGVKIQLPIPAGIAAGEYLAADQSGRTRRVTVSAATATGKVQREFYTVDAVNGDRWYFIRITSAK